MKKMILVLLLFFILSFPVLSQEPVTIFLPLILKGIEMPTLVEKWKVISPVESTNYVLNPSAEISGNFSALGGATVTRSTSFQKYGNYSYRTVTGSNGQGISLTLSSLPNENCFVTFRARGRLPVRLRAIIGTGLSTPLLIEKIDNQWNMYGALFSAAECNGRTELRLIQQGNGLGDFFVDGIQVENLEYWTSYIDGDQPGCAWNGPEHAATSTRSGLSREGGQIKDLFADYGFFVDKVIGAGATSRSIELDDYALLPGGELNEIKIQSRDWSLIGRFIADSDDEIFQSRKDLLTLLKKNAQKQPTKFLFYHPKGVREIKSFYAGGLEGDMSVFYDSWVTEDDDKWAELNKYIEKDAIQLKSPDPYFYELGEVSAALDPNDSGIFRLVAGRLKSTGQWSVLGPPATPGTAVYSSVRALAEDATYLYIGGDFTNFNNNASCDYICRYNKTTGVYSSLGVGVDGIVRAIVIGSDGTVYIAGNFINAGGVARNFIARWNPTTDTWASLGTGMDNGVRALAIGLDGTLYATGVFTTAGGVAAEKIAKWNGSVWSAMGSGLNSFGESLAIHPISGNLFVGGDFTSANAVACARVAEWNGTTFAPLGSGVDSIVYALAISPNGIVYLGGDFGTAGGVTVNNIASWNGSSFSVLGSGTNNVVYSLAVSQDEILFASGQFTSAGGITLADNLAAWNGYSWFHLDLDLPSSPIAYAIYPSKYVDPVIKQKYDLYLGFDKTGTGRFAGKTTINNEGSVDVFPKFVFERFGGTSLILETIKNENTGKQLLFNYSLQNEERLTIDLSPTKKSIISSFLGPKQNAILPNCDFGSFALETGNNNITVFTSGDIALYPSTIISFIQWRKTYESFD